MSARGIDRLPSGKYRVRVHIGGGRYRSKSFTRLRDAERWRQDIKAAKDTGRVAQVDADMQIFRDLITEHVAAKRAAGWEERTWATYRSLLEAHLRPHPLADLPCAQSPRTRSSASATTCARRPWASSPSAS